MLPEMDLACRKLLETICHTLNLNKPFKSYIGHYLQGCPPRLYSSVYLEMISTSQPFTAPHAICPSNPSGSPGGGPRVVVSTAALHARVRGSIPGLGGLKETKNVSSQSTCEISIVGSLRDREVACLASDRQGSNFESCVWRTVSSQSSHHPQEVLLAQFSLYVYKGGLKPDSFHFISGSLGKTLRPSS